jgi:hypothetical protein
MAQGGARAQARARDKQAKTSQDKQAKGARKTSRAQDGTKAKPSKQGRKAGAKMARH